MRNFFGKSILVAFIVMMACSGVFAQKSGGVAKNKGKMSIGANLNIESPPKSKTALSLSFIR